MARYRDPEAENRALNEEQAKAQAALIHDFMMTFGTEWGARVLKHLVTWGNVLQTTYVPDSPNASAFNEGVRNAIIYILTMSDRNHLEGV